MEDKKDLAPVFSFVIPGLGQIYNGHLPTGLLIFFLFVGLIWFGFYAVFWPSWAMAVMLWLFGIWDAKENIFKI